MPKGYPRPFTYQLVYVFGIKLKVAGEVVGSCGVAG